MVRGNKPGHDDSARAVDDLGVGGGNVGRNFGDRLPVDQNVGLLEVSQPGVEGEHDTSSQHNAAPPPIPDESLKLRRCGRAQITEGTRVLIFRYPVATGSRQCGAGKPGAAGRDKTGRRNPAVPGGASVTYP